MSREFLDRIRMPGGARQGLEAVSDRPHIRALGKSMTGEPKRTEGRHGRDCDDSSDPKETHGFQTEVRKLLDLMIHSLYSNKEIFLRELISNASDAADKLRFEALSDDGLYEGDGELKVRVSFDPDARTITVRDNGIGMTREEVAANLGTIARSGTRQFFESLTGDNARDTQLIGQFGVGFYSSFIVSDHVTVTSRRAGRSAAEGVRWESGGEGEYTIETTDVESRGTEVVLHLRDGEDEFLDRYRLRSIVRKYSDHVSIPDPDARRRQGRMTRRKEEAEDEAKDEETINAATAMWTRNKSELSTTTTTRGSTSTSPTISRIRSRGFTAGSKATSSTACCCSCRPAPRSTSGTAT